MNKITPRALLGVLLAATIICSGAASGVLSAEAKPKNKHHDDAFLSGGVSLKTSADRDIWNRYRRDWDRDGDIDRNDYLRARTIWDRNDSYRDRLEALRREERRLDERERALARAEARFRAEQRAALRDMALGRGRYGNTLDWRTRASLREFESLPPGIQKRILAGKPIPPGIAKRITYLPTSVNSSLGYPDYYRIGAYNDDYFLYNTRTNTVMDVLQGLLGSLNY